MRHKVIIQLQKAVGAPRPRINKYPAVIWSVCWQRNWLQLMGSWGRRRWGGSSQKAARTEALNEVAIVDVAAAQCSKDMDKDPSD